MSPTLSAQPLVWPVIALAGLTLAVWLRMFMLRIAFISSQRIQLGRLKSRTEASATFAPISAPADNFQNLFELPVLFYALVPLLILSGESGRGFVAGAWVFVGLRAVHSFIHCSYNQVLHRFYAYAAGAVVLFGLWIAFALRLAIA